MATKNVNEIRQEVKNTIVAKLIDAGLIDENTTRTKTGGYALPVDVDTGEGVKRVYAGLDLTVKSFTDGEVLKAFDPEAEDAEYHADTAAKAAAAEKRAAAAEKRAADAAEKKAAKSKGKGKKADAE